MVVALIILNIVLIILLVFFIIYFFNKNKDVTKKNCSNDKLYTSKNKIKNRIYKNKQKSERVFVGRFVSDEEYQQMTKNRKSEISILLEELDSEYEHFKELNK